MQSSAPPAEYKSSRELIIPISNSSRGKKQNKTTTTKLVSKDPRIKWLEIHGMHILTNSIWVYCFYGFTPTIIVKKYKDNFLKS